MTEAVNIIVNGFCKEVSRELAVEFAVEAQKLLAAATMELYEGIVPGSVNSHLGTDGGNSAG